MRFSWTSNRCISRSLIAPNPLSLPLASPHPHHHHHPTPTTRIADRTTRIKDCTAPFPTLLVNKESLFSEINSDHVVSILFSLFRKISDKKGDRMWQRRGNSRGCKVSQVRSLIDNQGTCQASVSVTWLLASFYCLDLLNTLSFVFINSEEEFLCLAETETPKTNFFSSDSRPPSI